MQICALVYNVHFNHVILCGFLGGTAHPCEGVLGGTAHPCEGLLGGTAHPGEGVLGGTAHPCWGVLGGTAHLCVSVVVCGDFSLFQQCRHDQGCVITLSVAAQIHSAFNGGVPVVLHSIVCPVSQNRAASTLSHS